MIEKLEQHVDKKKCIFCDYVGKLSGEHQFAKWIRTRCKLPFALADRSHILETKYIIRAPTVLPEHDVRTRYQRVSGDPGSRKLQVVCTRCNNNWMSTLQTDSQAILEKLIVGGRADFTGKVKYIAAWCTMTSMVFEHDGSTVVTFSEESRKKFNVDQLIPSNIVIWIGRMKQEPMSRRKAHGTFITDLGNFQATTVHIGEFLYQLITVPSRHDGILIQGEAWGMTRLWPFGSEKKLSQEMPMIPEESIEEVHERIGNLLLKCLKNEIPSCDNLDFLQG